MNGRLRWYLPRETDIAKMTQEELDQLAVKMNRCPRKCLFSSIKMIVALGARMRLVEV